VGYYVTHRYQLVWPDGRERVPNGAAFSRSAAVESVVCPFQFSFLYSRSRDSSIGIATGWTAGVRFSVGARDFSLQCPDRQKSTQPPIQWVSGSPSTEVKRPGRKADHSTPSSAEVKNSRAVTPLPCTSSWRGASFIKHRDNFTFYYKMIFQDLVLNILYIQKRNMKWQR
jgi:hypothetical protein